MKNEQAPTVETNDPRSESNLRDAGEGILVQAAPEAAPSDPDDYTRNPNSDQYASRDADGDPITDGGV